MKKKYEGGGKINMPQKEGWTIKNMLSGMLMGPGYYPMNRALNVQRGDTTNVQNPTSDVLYYTLLDALPQALGLEEIVYQMEGKVPTVNPETGKKEWRYIDTPKENGHTIIDSLIEQSENN